MNRRLSDSDNEGFALMMIDEIGAASTAMHEAAPDYIKIENRTKYEVYPDADPGQLTFVDIIWHDRKFDFQLKHSGENTFQEGIVCSGVGPKAKKAGISPGWELMWINDLPYSRHLWRNIEYEFWPIKLTFRHRKTKPKERSGKELKVRFESKVLGNAMKHEQIWFTSVMGTGAKTMGQEKGQPPNKKLVDAVEDDEIRRLQYAKGRKAASE